MIVSASWDRTVRLWDAVQGVAVVTLDGHDAEVTNVACDGTQRLVVSSSRDMSVRLWDLRQAGVRDVKVITGHTDSVASAVLMGGFVVSAGEDRFVKVSTCLLPCF